jgi:hypothetical protein
MAVQHSTRRSPSSAVRRRHGIVFVRASVVAALVLSACASHPAATSGLDSRQQDPGVVTMALQLMNLDPALGAAEQVLTEACVERHGLAIPLVPVHPQPRIGITGMAPFTQAEADRFGLALRLPDPEEFSLLNAALRDESERLKLVVLGSGSRRIQGPLGSSTSATGCLADARRRIYGSVRTYLDVTWFTNEVRQHQLGWTDDPRAKAAAGEYLSCMSKRGYSLRSFGEVFDMAARLAQTTPDFANAEREVAQAEVDCETASHVWATWNSLALQRVGPWLESQKDRMADLVQEAEEATDRALVVLGRDWAPAPVQSASGT